MPDNVNEDVKKGVDIDKNNVKYRDYLMKKAAIIKIVVFSVVLVIGAILSLIIPLRPTVSVSENRTLTKYPTFSVEGFMDGTYFSTVDKWFSDTFPFRDQLLVCNDRFTSLYGVRDTAVHGEIVAGDEIPEVDIDVDELMNPVGRPEKESGTAPTVGDENEETKSSPTLSTDASVSGTEETTSSTEISTQKPSQGQEESEKQQETGSEVKGETFGSIFVYGDSAYEYYVFSQKNSEQYVSMVNDFANCMGDNTSFYSIIIPNSMDIALNDDVRKGVTSSDQRKAILYMYSKMGQNVNKTFVFDMLRGHKDEYLYFRTDHHWTALAAYYTYCMVAQQMGMTPNSLDRYEKKEFTNFQGSFYTSTKAQSLVEKPDTVVAYVPMATNSLKYMRMNNDIVSYRIIADVSNFQPRNKYSTFIGGDNPYTEIVNPNLNDGSSCLVIKESYGNAFVPFLVDHFQYVYVIDYRYYNGTATELVKEKNIANVIMINNIVATTASGNLALMKKVCK